MGRGASDSPGHDEGGQRAPDELRAPDDAALPTDGRPEGEGDAAPRLGMLANAVAFHLRIAQDASFRSFARRSGQLDIRPGCFAAMEVIASNPGITASVLGRAIARDKSSVTPLIQYLLRRGLVKRTPSEADRRRMHLELTPSGREVLGALQQTARAHDADLDRVIGDAKPQLVAMLKKIADTLNS